MIRALIKNLSGNVTHRGDFETQEMVNAWLSVPANIKSWGGDGNYTVEQSDVTASYDMLALIKAGEKAQFSGMKILSFINASLKAKGISDANADLMISDTNLLAIERFLRGGYLLDAKRRIQSLDNTFFTEQEKTAFSTAIDDALASL